jgi:hypothetical protein
MGLLAIALRLGALSPQAASHHFWAAASGLLEIRHGWVTGCERVHRDTISSPARIVDRRPQTNEQFGHRQAAHRILQEAQSRPAARARIASRTADAHGELRLVDDDITEQDQVEIERSRGSGMGRSRPASAQSPAFAGQCAGVEPRLSDCDGVQKTRLISRHADRIGFVN